MFAKVWKFLISPGLMAVVTIAGFAFGIYGTMFYEKRPGAIISVESDSPVFDVHTNISKLSIAYAGRDLRKSNQTLRLIRVRLVNIGKTDIVKMDYDENDPVGVDVKNGTIVEVPRLSGSNDYLQRNSRISSDSGKIKFLPVILEPGEFVEAQFMVLTAPAAEVSISAFGKLAGIREMAVIRADQNSEKASLWNRVTEADSWTTQLARGPLYFMWFIVEMVALSFGMALFVLPVASVVEYWIKRGRRLRMASYVSGRALSQCEKTVIQNYYERGKNGLARIFNFVEQVERRNELIGKLQPILGEREIRKVIREVYPVLTVDYERLQSGGVAREEGAVIILDSALQKTLTDVCGVLDISIDDLKQSTPEKMVEFVG